MILSEAKRVVRTRGSLVIAETRHGFICASAGVDASNAPEPGTLVLLPVDPDASASRLRDRLGELTGREVGVIVTDSFGRPWRQGTTDVAIGAAGIEVLRDLKGERDPNGYELKSTVIAIADEIAGAAQLVMGKLDRTPVAIVRGLDVAGDGSAATSSCPQSATCFPSASTDRARNEARSGAPFLSWAYRGAVEDRTAADGIGVRGVAPVVSAGVVVVELVSTSVTVGDSPPAAKNA